jgi:excisionase family DNA binding protein
MTATRDAVIVGGEDGPEVRALEQALQEHRVASGYLVLDDGNAVSLPVSVTDAIRHLIGYLVRGDQVAIGPADQGYSVTEAATQLGIWPPRVQEILERGELPHRLIGGEPRIAHADLQVYRTKLRERRLRGVREIQKQSEEEGAYDRW